MCVCVCVCVSPGLTSAAGISRSKNGHNNRSTAPQSAPLTYLPPLVSIIHCMSAITSLMAGNRWGEVSPPRYRYQLPRNWMKQERWSRIVKVCVCMCAHTSITDQTQSLITYHPLIKHNHWSHITHWSNTITDHTSLTDQTQSLIKHHSLIKHNHWSHIIHWSNTIFFLVMYFIELLDIMFFVKCIKLPGLTFPALNFVSFPMSTHGPHPPSN